ncbi:unnamed protein product [Rotaria sordida]|uniref:Uncharacterized protein n=1 Tax=Rotaria sordida TaxID=392033 RepID=A0A814IM74_9BILA|nr:unnamed protein product [Rotaria sordida]
MYYSPLVEVDSTSHHSTTTIDSTGSTSHIRSDRNDHLCRICKNQLIKKQPTHHTPIECLSQRCEFLELEIVQLKDRDTKSRSQIKQLEDKIIRLEDAIKGLTAPREQLAAPFAFGGKGHKHRHQLKKSKSGDMPLSKSNINYDNILQSNRPNSRERIGLFGSLGASSQQH